jgi:Na+/H+-dicarboxylate symporter
MLRLALHWQILIAVVAAAALGLALNATLSTYDAETEITEGPFQGKVLVVHDSSDRIEIQLKDSKGNLLPGQHWVVDPTGATKKSFPTLSLLKEKEPKVFNLFKEHGRSTSRQIGDWANNLGQLFLRMLKMISVPLIITSLMTGVLGLADAGRLRKLFGITFAYYITTSMLAIVTGIFLVNLIQPGHRGQQAGAEAATTKEVQGDMGEVMYRQVETMIPENPFAAIAASDFLSIISFTLAFGVFTLLVGGKPLEVMRDFFQAGFDIMMKMTMAIVYLAPFGVFFLMLAATATQGAEVFRTLGWYMLTVFSGLAFHAVVTLPLIIFLIGRRNPWRYSQAMAPALMTAFSSASSNATLPLTMNCVEKRAGIDNRVGSFVLPLGATINMDGTALFEVVAVLFIAQMEPSINLTLTQQIMVAITALLASVGAAGIPHAGLVMMVIVLQAVGLPADRVGMILAVDRILDMCRTTVNVWSDMCGCAVVARYETDLPPDPGAAAPDGQGP